LLAQYGSWYPRTSATGFFVLPVFSASALVTVRFRLGRRNPADHADHCLRLTLDQAEALAAEVAAASALLAGAVLSATVGST
jgi:hypothetical protein